MRVILPTITFLLMVGVMLYCMAWLGENVGPASEAISEAILSGEALI